MKKFWMILVVVGICLGVAGIVMAGSTADQTATFQVQAINEISVSDNPEVMTIDSATAGSQPDAVTNTGTTYSITTNGTDKKITAALDSDMPAGVTLKMTLAAPTGAESNGAVALDDTAKNMVTGISTLAESGKTITYELSALVTAGVLSSNTRTVTLTIADGD